MQVKERYELEAIVGSGGMGAVHRARDLRTGATVAVKVLREHAGAELRKRFAREARVLAEITHPAVVRYLDHGSDEEGRPFLVMEWLEGRTLDARLGEGPLGFADALTIAKRTADALAVLHARRMVHRDVKPSNLFLPADDVAETKLLDFGIAHGDFTSIAVTRTGSIVGTPDYMAPEQARAEPKIFAAADVFSLGCVLYHCLAGEPPFTGNRVVAVLAKILFSDPTPVEARADVPPELAELIGRMLKKDPSARPRDGAALASELAAISITPAPKRAQQVADTLRPRIGSVESQVVSVVLACGTPDKLRGASARASAAREEMATAVDVRPQIAALLSSLEGLSASVSPLAEGGLAATITGGASAVDGASAACRVALRVRAAMPGVPIAVATGRAVLTEALPVGRVIDGAVDLLEGLAPGRVRIDDATAGLLDARFAVDGDERALYLGGERARTDVVRRFLGRETAMVGRNRELRALSSLASECANERVARAALVVAPPGLGKSRLRYELVRAVREERPETGVWIGWGDPIRTGSAFALLGEAIRRELDIGEGEDHALSRARLRARAGRFFEGAERDDVAVFLGELIGVPFEEAEHPGLRAARRENALMRDRMRSALLSWLGAECDARPIVLVLEDLHFGDEASLELVDRALLALSDRPLFVLALGRPAVRTTFPDLWRERPLDTIELRELSAKAASELVKSVLEVDAATVERIVGLAGGNAFYLEELIRGVAEGRAELPDSISGMVQARLEALDAELRRTLRAAAVLGETFWESAVAALLDEKQDVVRERLRTLESHELVDARPTSRFGAERELVFRHALVYETAYATLTKEDRALGHRLAGRWLEGAGEHDALLLAEHYDRGGEREAAARWLAKSAAIALTANDIRAARSRAERGLALDPVPEVTAQLCLALAEVERWSGQHLAAQENAERAVSLLEQPSALRFRAIEEALFAAGRLGDHDRVEDLAEQAARAGADEQLSGQAACLSTAARFLFHAGRYAAALAHIGRVESILEQHGERLDAIAIAEIHRVRAARARQFGDPAGDAEGYAQALLAYERAGDVRNACNARVSYGFALAELGALDRALAELERALADAERDGLMPIATRAKHNLGLVLCELGALDRAWEIETRAALEAHRQGDARLEGGSQVYLAMIAHRAGRYSQSLEHAAAAEVCFDGMPPARAGALAAEARALVALGRGADAYEIAERAMALLGALGGVEEYESLIRLAFAESLRATGRDEDARTVVRDAERRLNARAAYLPDLEARERFLTNDSENAALIALARTMR